MTALSLNNNWQSFHSFQRFLLTCLFVWVFDALKRSIADNVFLCYKKEEVFKLSFLCFSLWKKRWSVKMQLWKLGLNSWFQSSDIFHQERFKTQTSSSRKVVSCSHDCSSFWCGAGTPQAFMSTERTGSGCNVSFELHLQWGRKHTKTVSVFLNHPLIFSILVVSKQIKT